MKLISKIGLLLLGIVCGYIAMVLGLFLSQDVFFGGIVIGETKIWELAIAGVGAVMSAFIGGWVAGTISKWKNYLPQIILAIETLIEATYLFIEGQFPNPLWFDIMSELTLIVGIIGGGYFYLFKSNVK